ncbi:BON domain-containing protein [Henriciella litoralis]|uniref:BON domain-containing protein n=1 Tax=Henriciella litoralis TaxID=568102 RepID=UPI000A0634AE|nr:BON domain-containing protein [Henriciella litoralis]
MRKSLLIAAALAVTTMTAGCATVQDKSFGEAIDDSTASNEIKAKLIREGGYGEVDVEVAGGLALLSGRVSTPEMRVKAEEIAWSSTRINDVANEIQIEGTGGFFANASDELITARVRSSLLASKSVKSVNYNIETYDGVVYLMGIARSDAELQEAAERASVVGGVRQVVSYVQVRPPVAGNRGARANRATDNGASNDELLGGTY